MRWQALRKRFLEAVVPAGAGGGQLAEVVDADEAAEDTGNADNFAGDLAVASFLASVGLLAIY